MKIRNTTAVLLSQIQGVNVPEDVVAKMWGEVKKLLLGNIPYARSDGWSEDAGTIGG